MEARDYLFMSQSVEMDPATETKTSSKNTEIIAAHEAQMFKEPHEEKTKQHTELLSGPFFAYLEIRD